MKEIIIIVIILIIVYLGAYYTQEFLNETSDMLVDKLEDLKENIQIKNISEDKLKMKIDETYNEWKTINEKWSVIVLHNEIDLIETSLIHAKAKIETGNVEESMEDIDTSIFLLKHIKEKEKTNLKNIF